jgi:hypothetical protein
MRTVGGMEGAMKQDRERTVSEKDESDVQSSQSDSMQSSPKEEEPSSRGEKLSWMSWLQSKKGQQRMIELIGISIILFVVLRMVWRKHSSTYDGWKRWFETYGAVQRHAALIQLSQDKRNTLEQTEAITAMLQASMEALTAKSVKKVASEVVTNAGLCDLDAATCAVNSAKKSMLELMEESLVALWKALTQFLSLRA